MVQGKPKSMNSNAGRKTRNVSRSAMQVANKAMSVARQANKHELKYLDTDQSSLTGFVGPAGTYLWTTCTELIQGTASNRRVGNVINATSLNLRGVIEYNPLSVTSNQLVRLIVFQNLNSGVPSAVTDYLQALSFNSHKSIDNRFNTATIFDKVYEVSADHVLRNLNLDLKLKKKMIPYGNSPAAPERHNISVLAISTEPITLQGPIVYGQIRLFFHDK